MSIQSKPASCMHKYKFKNENIQLSQEREVHTQLNKKKKI